MPNLRGLKAGDPILIPKGWRGPEHEEKTVTKAARKYVYVGEGVMARKFLIASGFEEGDFSGRRAYSREGFAEIGAREAAVESFVRLGMGEAYAIRRFVDGLTWDAIERLLGVLDPTYFGKYADLYAGPPR